MQHVGIAVLNVTTGFADAVQACGAGCDHGQVRALKAVTHGHVTRNHVDDGRWHEEWRNATRTFVQVFAVHVFDERQAANARADHDANARRFFFAQGFASGET
jgi:hypothetical protein